MEQLKIAWKVDSKDDVMPMNFTYLNLDDFDDVNSIDDVRSKIEEILQQDFEADIDYIVYDFYHISNKIFDKVVVTSSPVSKINNSTTNLGCLGWGFIIFFVLWIFSLLNPSHKESCAQIDNDLTYPKGTPDRSYLQKFDKYVAECTK